MRSLLTLLLISLSTFLIAQDNVAINNSGSPADPSAILDVQSNDKGMLVPRMGSSQRTMISNAAPGLLVYDTDSESFWFKDTQGWVELVNNARGLRDSDKDTRIEVEANPDEDKIRMTTGGAGIAEVDANGMRLQGNLGIGITTAAHPLHVRKDGDSTQTVVGLFQSPVSKRPTLQFSESTNNALSSGMSIEYNGLGNGPDNEIRINAVGGEPVVTFENNGETGIGTTQPNGKLHVVSNGAGTYPQLLLYESSTTDYARMNFQNQSGASRWTIAGKTAETQTGSELNFYNSVFGGDVLKLRGDGRVGIGATPAARLHVNSALSENPFRVQYNGSTKMYVQTNGGTSIGSTNTPPPNGLHVEGDIRMDGDDIESTQTLRLNSDTRIELVVGTNTLVIDPVEGITITSDDDIAFVATNNITFAAGSNITMNADADIVLDALDDVFLESSMLLDLKAGTELELNSGTITDMNIGSSLTMNSGAVIDLVAGTELELNGFNLDVNMTSLVDVDSGDGGVFIDGGEVYLNTDGNSTAQAIHQSSGVLNPPCGGGCNGILQLGSTLVFIGY